MFKRIIYDDWVMIVPIISFCFTFGVFALTTVRALLISKERREHLACLPLQDSITARENPHVS